MLPPRISQLPDMTICNCVAEISQLIAGEMDSGDRIGGIGEESITDYMLMRLNERIFRIRIVGFNKFSKYREKRNGADWEGWIRARSGRSIGIRVQAKKLFSNRLYKSLYANNKARTRQVNKLKREAERVNGSPLPIYMFYNNDGISANPAYRLELCAKCPFPKSVWGCSISNAEEIRQKILEKTREFEEIELVSRPWCCMFCTSRMIGYPTDNFSEQIEIVDVIYSFLRQFGETIQIKPEIYQELPNYVEKTIKLFDQIGSYSEEETYWLEHMEFLHKNFGDLKILALIEEK